MSFTQSSILILSTRALFIAIFCIISALSVSAYTLDQPNNRYHFELWPIKNSLSLNYITSIAQTPDGYIWVGTETGLLRFNGDQFLQFNKDVPNGIGNFEVIKLVPSRDKGLWIATRDGGVFFLKDGKFERRIAYDEALYDRILDIYEDRDGRLWMATSRKGVICFNNGSLTYYDVEDGLPNNSVSSVYQDREGSMWFGTWEGLVRLKDGRLSTFTIKGGSINNHIRSIYEDSSGNLWIGTTNSIGTFNDEQFTIYQTKETIENIGLFYEDSYKNLWVGTDGEGLNLFYKNRLVSINDQTYSLGKTISSIYQDIEGNIWVGSRGIGLIKVTYKIFTTLSTPEGLSHQRVNGIYGGSDGSLWIATKNGLNSYKDGKFKVLKREDGLPSNHITTVIEDKRKTLWLSTLDEGVVSIKDGKITTFTTSNGLTSNRVNSLFEDRDGSIWIGAGDDLLIYKDGLFKQVNIAQFASGVRVRAMAQTSDGSIWIGTLLGLLRIRGSDIRIYTQRDGLSDHRIFTLYVDKDGTLWIGTAGGGLNRFKHGTFLYYKHSYGFPTDSITSIIEDDQESIWIGSNQGIFRVSKHLFDDFDQKRIEHITSFSYDSSDGIRNGECNNVQYGSWKDRDGNVWFATIDGIVVAAPSKIQLNTIPPLVYIEEVLADRLPIDLERNNRLSPSIRDIEIRYAGLSFVATEKVKFKYLLEGFDKEWIDAGNRRFAHYTNLPPGHYTFKVIASNNDGIWNQKGDTFAFYIRPHIYQTWWFIALCALILMLIVWQVHSWSVRQMKRRMTLIMDERTRLARELHDTLEQSLAMASMHLESGTAMLDGISERAMHHLELARTLVSHTVSEAKRAVWDLRSENLENADLMTAFSKIAHQLNIDNLISVEVKVSGKSRPIPSNIEHTLFRIGQEAITNAVKHARASRIEVEIEFNPGSIILSVRDNGAGFDPLSVPSISKGHFGIAGMRERAEGIGGTFSIKSDAKDGSEISVEVKT